MHFPISLITVACFLVGTAVANRKVVTKGIIPAAFNSPSADNNVTTFFPLTRSRSSSRSSRSVPFLEAFRKGYFGIAPTFSLQQGQSWYTNLKIGTTTYALIVDTGSSDTWIAETGFQCYDVTTRAALPENLCLFGPTYTPGKDFKRIENENFDTYYGDGEFLTGSFGKIDVCLGGINVNQQIALANNAGWFGDGISSGLVGFAYPSITAAFSGTNITNDSASNQAPYNPLFTSMYSEGLIPPMFSIALSRASGNPVGPDGYIALGGLPPVATYGDWAHSPIQYVQIGTGYVQGILPWPQYQFYTITPDAFLYEGSSTTAYKPQQWSPLGNPNGTSRVQVILDSGTTLIWLPTPISNAVAALFSPPAEWNLNLGAYSVACTAHAPSFAVKIGGIVFPVDKRDMIMDDGTGNGTCISGISDGETYAPYVLGDVFMKNVLVVFDVGASQLRFRSRGNY